MEKILSVIKNIWLTGTKALSPSERQWLLYLIIFIIIFMIFMLGKGQRGMASKRRKLIRQSYRESREYANNNIRKIKREKTDYYDDDSSNMDYADSDNNQAPESGYGNFGYTKEDQIDYDPFHDSSEDLQPTKTSFFDTIKEKLSSILTRFKR